jgi:hypothetical protein
MKNINTIVFLLICIILSSSCKNHAKKSNVNENPQAPGIEKVSTENEADEDAIKIVYSEDKGSLKAYYDLPAIKEYYDWQRMTYSPPPELNYPNDLKPLSYEDLRLLKYEIFARNGYLFKDGFLRGYFNRFKWYMPVFGVDTFKVILNQKESDLIDRILAEEAKRKENKTIAHGGLQLYNADLIVNKKQFTEIPGKVMQDFKEQNFSIVNANEPMPFYIYDDNAYQKIPHYITTDLYLFILHKYFSKFLEKLDENYMYNQLKTILTNTSRKLSELSNTSIESNIEWAKMYNSLALYAIGDSSATPPDKYKSVFLEEKRNIDSQRGIPLFIDNKFVDYEELKPRGHYTKSDDLRKYFRGFKWISLNGINLDNEEQLKGLVLFAYIIKSNQELDGQYKQFVSVMEKLAGQEDNLSLSDVVNSLSAKTVDEALSAINVASIKKQLESLNKEKIRKVFGESFQTEEKGIKRVYFISGTYSINGEIFSKLVHIDGINSKRPFPRGLDIPAVFGSATAQAIIINEYKDNEAWPDYLSRLKKLQEQFKGFSDWNQNYGFIGLKTALASCAEQDSYPDFMKTDAYNRKELSTTLASWTHTKHDLILYQEKPYAAETGQGGGGPPDPEHYCYVEPNLEFWDSALELVEWLEDISKNESTFEDLLGRIRELGIKLKTVAYKEIEGKEVTVEEYKQLHYVGGTIEYILLGLLENDHLPERERSMALIADVYVYNGENLNVAVGHADDIYVIVPFDGEYYITRGAIFSYYEFTGKIFNDEEWKGMIERKEIPDRPKWIKPLINNVTPLKGQMQFRE